MLHKTYKVVMTLGKINNSSLSSLSLAGRYHYTFANNICWLRVMFKARHLWEKNLPNSMANLYMLFKETHTIIIDTFFFFGEFVFHSPTFSTPHPLKAVPHDIQPIANT